jgi:anaerobic carbon-monoxide dehydrogenase iron sulfur subunit
VIKLVAVDPDKCTGCRLCEMACSFRHAQECNSTKSRIRILHGKEWAFDFPLLCMQCAEAPCVESCPTNALHRDEGAGVVLHDVDLCSGCEQCVSACPVQALSVDAEQMIVFKCDLCGGDPECVKWCTRGALIFREIDINSPDRQVYSDKASRCLESVGY